MTPVKAPLQDVDLRIGEGLFKAFPTHKFTLLVESTLTLNKGAQYAERVYPRILQDTHFSVEVNQRISRKTIERIFQLVIDDPDLTITLLPALIGIVRSSAEKVIAESEKMSIAGFMLLRNLGEAGCPGLLEVHSMEKQARQQRAKRGLQCSYNWMEIVDGQRRFMREYSASSESGRQTSYKGGADGDSNSAGSHSKRACTIGNTTMPPLPISLDSSDM